MATRKFLTRTIWILSLVSLFTDIASEMLYPVMPLYLKSIGFSIIFIGILEGLAEATAGLSKGYFGNWSDNIGKRLPFVQLGYGLSALAKPLMAIFQYPLWVFAVRTLDRLGKGVRTGARDALLSDETTPEFKARVFGFHRSLDTLGAVLGPSLALLYLYFYPEQYKSLFFWAFIPGVIAIALTLLIKEKAAKPATKNKPALLDFIKYWKKSPAQYRQLTSALLLFTLFNSSDLFLILKIKESGLSDSMAIGIYIFYNLVYALASYPMGIWADKWGMKRVYLSGLLMFAIVYAGVSFANSTLQFLGLFLLYGIYAAATEGVAKAWITNICDKKDTATAIGTFTAFQSVMTLLASTFAGFIWANFGAPATFLLTAVMAVVVMLYLQKYAIILAKAKF
jgi:MFS family permease